MPIVWSQSRQEYAPKMGLVWSVIDIELAIKNNPIRAAILLQAVQVHDANVPKPCTSHIKFSCMHVLQTTVWP